MADIQVLAARVDDAARTATAIAQLSRSTKFPLADAYSIQKQSIARRIARGERPVGGEFMFKRRSGSETAHDNAAAKRSDQAQQERGRARPRGALAWSRRARDERDQRCNSP